MPDKGSPYDKSVRGRPVIVKLIASPHREVADATLAGPPDPAAFYQEKRAQRRGPGGRGARLP